ncbi:hypothetical protein HYZ70_04060 [Candidatus Curtissbacteria bacterium]|nr:hypothetical protein [Candidatus Curtissbacteria bacterium]
MTLEGAVSIDLKPLTEWELKIENLARPFTDKDLFGLVRDVHPMAGSSILPVQPNSGVGDESTTGVQLDYWQRELGKFETSSIRFFSGRQFTGRLDIRREGKTFVMHQVFSNSDIAHPIVMEEPKRRKLALNILKLHTNISEAS